MCAASRTLSESLKPDGYQAIFIIFSTRPDNSNIGPIGARVSGPALPHGNPRSCLSSHPFNFSLHHECLMTSLMCLQQNKSHSASDVCEAGCPAYAIGWCVQLCGLHQTFFCRLPLNAIRHSATEVT